MPDVIEVLADLVAIPSVNPMGRDVSGPEYGEAGVADYVADFLQRHNIKVERQPVQPGRENLLAHVPGARHDLSVLLETHMDTVPADGMEIAPFEPVQKGGRLYGRGSCDAKASLAAMMVALVEVARSGAPIDVWLCAAVDEEFTFGGAAHLVSSGFRVDYVVVGEPTRLRVVTAHKGAVRWIVTTSGRAAHAATPWEGENAIYKMARVVQALEHYAAVLQGQPPHPRLGPRTLNVGTIEGGQTVNTVPDRCSVSVDRRVLPGESLAEVAGSMAEYLSGEGLGEHTQVKEILRDAPMEMPDDSPWVQAVLAAASTVSPALRHAVHYGTDASKFAEAGMPAVVLGPGDIAQAHTANEWVETEQVQAAETVYGHLLAAPPQPSAD
jgi:acetylornithine deacetylase ArgE